MSKLSIWIWISLLVGIVLIGCTQTNTTDTAKTTKDQDQQMKERPVKEFTMTSFVEVIDGKYYPQFSVKEITVKKGDLVRIKVTNTKGSHDFKIDEFNVYSETPLDQQVTIEFVADKTGSFEYYCTKPGHRQNGQFGTIKVTE